MNKAHFYVYTCLLLFMTSCNGQNQATLSQDSKNQSAIISDEQPKSHNASRSNRISDDVKCGLLDKEGVLWFGTNNGVYSYDGTAFTHFSVENGLCNNQVIAIIEDVKGNLWFGTDDGLCRYDRKRFTHIPIPFSDTSSLWLDKVYPIINPNAVHALAQDKKGNIWIGTGGAGVYQYADGEFKSFLTEIGTKQEDSLYHNWVPSITVDDEGNVWCASMTHGGVSRYDGEVFTHFMPKDGLSDDMIRTIFLDSAGNIWFGFNGNRNSGLTYYNGKSFVTFSAEDGLCNKSILTICEDKNGHLWLGSGRGGICIYNGKSFTAFTMKEGQSFGVIRTIIEDAAGNVWFGGPRGLWRFDGETITSFFESN